MINYTKKALAISFLHCAAIRTHALRLLDPSTDQSYIAQNLAQVQNVLK